MLPILAALYIGLALFAFFLSDSMIFLPHPSSYQDSAEILKLTTGSGKKISAVYLPNPTAKFTLLVSHGNAEDLGDDKYWLDGLRHAGFSVFAYDYEGYGTSEGRPARKPAMKMRPPRMSFWPSILRRLRTGSLSLADR